MNQSNHTNQTGSLRFALFLLLTFLIISPAQAAWTVVNSLTGGDVTALTRDSAGNVFALANSVKLYGIQRTDTYKSTDDGASWARIQVDSSVTDLNITGIIADGNGNVFANAQSSVTYGVSYGIYKSTDGGSSWSNISSDGAVYFTDNSNNIFASFPSGGMMKSTDGGGTWTAISGAVASSQCADSGSILLCYNRGLYGSSDGGNNWSSVTSDLPVNGAGGRTVHALVADGSNFYASVDAGFIYAGGVITVNRGVYKSSDGGSTWVAVNTGMANTSSTAFSTTTLTAGASNELYVSVIDFNNGVTIYRSTDGAANWSSVLTPPTPAQALLVSGATVLAGMEDSGIKRSTDSGSTWSASNAGLTAVHVNALMSRANGDLLAATSDMDVAISSDNGASWNTSNIGGSTSGHRVVADLSEDSSGNLYAPGSFRAVPSSGTEGRLFKSTDSGTTWTSETWPASTLTTGTALEFSNADSTLYLGTGVGIYTSTDGAASWTHTGNNTSIAEPSDLLAAANGDVYITSTGLSRSSDSGATWNTVTTGAALNADIFQDGSGTLFAFGIDLRKSTDNGTTWSAAISVLPVGGSANALLDDGAGTFYLAISGATTVTQSGVYVSTDGGNSWTQNNTGLGNLEVEALTLGSDGNVYAGTNGGGLYRMVAGGGDTTNPVVTAPADITVATASVAGTPASNATIAAFLAAATATDNVAVVGSVANDAPTTFAAGTTTTVTFSASDAAGNTGTATATVTIGAFSGNGDTTNPVVTAPADITVAAASVAGTPASNATIAAFLAAATATDNVAVVGSVTNDAPTTFAAGTTTTVTFSASDAAGNTGTATATVTVGAFSSGGSGGGTGGGSTSSSGGGGAFGLPGLLALLFATLGLRARARRNIGLGLLATGIVLLTGCASAPKAPASFDANNYASDKAGYAQRYVKVKDADELKALKRVVIPSFQVEFITQSSATASAVGGFGSKGGARASSTYKLAGLDETALQAVTDKLYNDLVQRLKDSGVEVVSLDQLQGNDAWPKLVAKGAASPNRGKSRLEPDSGESLVFAPTGMGIYYSITDPKIGFSEVFGGIGATNSGTNPGSYEGRLMEAFSASMLKARYVVSFAQISTEGSTFSKTAGVSANWRFALAPKTTELVIFTEFDKYKAPFADTMVYRPKPDESARIMLGTAMLNPAPFVQSVEDVTPTSGKIVEGVFNALSILSGSGNTSKTRQYKVSVDAPVYQQQAEQYISAMSEMFVERIREAR